MKSAYSFEFTLIDEEYLVHQPFHSLLLIEVFFDKCLQSILRSFSNIWYLRYSNSLSLIKVGWLEFNDQCSYLSMNVSYWIYLYFWLFWKVDSFLCYSFCYVRLYFGYQYECYYYYSNEFDLLYQYRLMLPYLYYNFLMVNRLSSSKFMFDHSSGWKSRPLLNLAVRYCLWLGCFYSFLKLLRFDR